MSLREFMKVDKFNRAIELESVADLGVLQAKILT